MMAVGESGLGKSTLINSLFLTNLYEDREVPEAAVKQIQTVSIEASTVEIEERGVKESYLISDTQDFYSALNLRQVSLGARKKSLHIFLKLKFCEK